MDLVSSTFNEGWHRLVEELYFRGMNVNPRGMGCREITGVSLKVTDGRENILVDGVRNTSYRFAVAEWLWIWFGHDDVQTIARYSSQIARYSDNGVTFDGAYGPRIRRQWPTVINTLNQDNDSRQAVIQIYNERTTPSKDVPCTLTLQFLIREGKVDTIATMRSSDVWLGLPYDFFTFSMLGNTVASYFNLGVGYVKMQLGSSHLYDRNYDEVTKILKIQAEGGTRELPRSPMLPSEPPGWLQKVLMGMEYREGDGEQQPWETYAKILQTPGTATSLRLIGTL